MAEAKSHMKVLMTADTVGGVWTYCMDLCRALQDFGVEVHLVTMGDKLQAWQWKEALELENVVLYDTAFQLEWMLDPWQDVEECGEWLLQLEETVQPDLVHLNCFAYGALPFTSPVLVVAHSDVWSWFLAVKGKSPSAEWNRYFDCVKMGLQGADKVVAPSGAMLKYMEKIYGVQDGEVIYNGRNEALFWEAQKQTSVLSMGRIWDEAKNTKLLAEAAPLIIASIKIAGDNSFEQNSFVTKTNKVEYLGKLSTSRIAEELSTAAIYVLPAKYEPFGLSALEAALSGCALVLGDIPTLREIWKDAALYVDISDAENLASTVNALLSDEERLKEWSNKAKKQAANYSAKRMAEQYLGLYRQLQTKKINLQQRVTV